MSDVECPTVPEVMVDETKLCAKDNRSTSPLSADAPAFVPPSKTTHIITLFNPVDYSTVPLHCDLVTLTLNELRNHAVQQLNAAPGSFELLFNGQPLPEEGKALDVGIGNGAVVVAQTKTSVAMPSLPMMSMMAPFQMYHMALANMAALAGGSPPLTPMGGSPLPSPHHLNAMPPVGAAPQPIELPAASSLPSSRSVSPHITTAGPSTDNPSLVSTEFCTYALTSDGSRALINALQGLPDPTDTVDQLIPIIKPKFVTLATHQHASKVIIGIGSVASASQVAQLLNTACGKDLVDLCETNAGSDVLVALIGCMGSEGDATGGLHALIETMCPNIVNFCTSVNGRKVLQAILSHLPNAETSPIYDAVCANLVSLATDQCGCITLQRMYDYATDPQLKSQLQLQLLEYAPHLITDPYGNYVLQHVVKDCPAFSQLIAKLVCGRVLEFAVNKFASNVIERCMQTGPDEVRHALILELCQPTVLSHLMQDAYGNYVVQSAVDNAPFALLDALKDAIMPLTARSPYGYRIETKLQKRLKSCGRNWNRGGGRTARKNPAEAKTPFNPQVGGMANPARQQENSPFFLGTPFQALVQNIQGQVRMPLQQLPSDNIQQPGMVKPNSPTMTTGHTEALPGI